MFSERPIDARGRWLALIAATVVYQFAYWPIVTSVIDAQATSGGLWLGLAVTPLVFLVLAFVSRNPRAPGSTARAMGLFLVIGLTVGLANIVVGLVAGFAAGAAATLRREPEVHGLSNRIVGIAVVGSYVIVLSLLTSVAGGIGGFTVMSGAVLPLAIIGLADEVSEVRSAGRAGTPGSGAGQTVPGVSWSRGGPAVR